jgi:2-polyprenyl-6-methoxyphenol hydroxylase-like FAD-dependent oxidoreductase
VGAGPSGLLLAIMLAKQGIQIQMLEAGHELDKNPRAAHYGPSAVYDFTRAGIIDEVNARGIFPDAFCWRNPDGSLITGMRMPKDMEYPMVVLPLDQFDKLQLDHLEKLPGTEVLFGHKVIGIEHGDTEAKVKVQTADGLKEFSGDYVVGADGASSQIRRSLFGDEYPGETLPQQIIATNVAWISRDIYRRLTNERLQVYYDFRGKHDYWDSNFIIHPTDWYMAARITSDGLWRCTYGDIAGLTKEEYQKRQPMRYAQILPGAPQPGDYKVIMANPYKLQQRCAPSFRVGRFILVADAAHLCNPL